MIANPFIKPELINYEINIKVRNMIQEEINKGTLDLHSMLKVFQETLLQKNIVLGQILAYYITNVVISSRYTSDQEKIDLINDMKSDIIKLREILENGSDENVIYEEL